MKENWIKNSLGYESGISIYQDKTMFNYSVDTILLGNFATINSKIKNVLEIGVNNGALSIFISERSNKIKIDAVEIQSKAIEIAKVNIEMNGKTNQIKLINADFNDYAIEYAKKQGTKYDLIICNPPFYKIETKPKRDATQEMLIATHEFKLNFDQIFEGAAKIIEQKGYIALVLPPERLVDILISMRKYNFEPKRVKMIFPREDQKPNLVLVEARFQAGWGTIFESNIYLHPNDKSVHRYTDEVFEIYKPIKLKEK
ncbi:MAG: tRNA1(Val) (adenine(37)-N6)-methyltransferase [Metamycoplasmataceae bacterium]